MFTLGCDDLLVATDHKPRENPRRQQPRQHKKPSSLQPQGKNAPIPI